MYHVDNKTGVATMPDIPPSESAMPQWFTEGGPGEEPTIPGSTTWNIWQAELLNILAAAEVVPDKFKLNQIAESIGLLIARGIEDAALLPGSSYKPRTDSLNNQQGAIAYTKNKDMNTCIAGEFGLYEKATCTNTPPGAGSYFYCETKSIYAQTALIQIAWTYDGAGVLAWRNYSVNTHTWGTWRESYDTGRKPTAADVGALAKTGDTATGNLTAPKLIMSAAQGTGAGDAVRYDFTASQMPNRYTVLGASKNLNDYQTPGFYAQPSNADAASGSNYPAAIAGTLLVFRHAGVCQLYITYASDGSRRIFHRNLYSPTWSAWATIYDTNFKPTAADVGAAPASHTHTAAQGNADVVASGVGQIGTYGFFYTPASGAYAPGRTLPGSSLRWSSTDMHESDLGGGSPAGTWKLMGYYPSNAWTKSLWIRIA